MRLIVNYYRSPNRKRQEELDRCLQRNLTNKYIHEVVILGNTKPPDHVKIKWIKMDTSKKPYGRPTYQQFFDVANSLVTSPYELTIISNLDIFFDDSLSLIKTVSLEGACLALTRHDLTEKGYEVTAWDNCQDTWVFQGKIPPINGAEWPLGIFGCDGAIAWKFSHASCRVLNPCYSIKTFHDHESGIRYNGYNVDGSHENVPRKTLEDCRLPAPKRNKTGVISFSLYGSIPKYTIGMIRNAELARHIYPGWLVRVYVDSTVPLEIKAKLRYLKADVVERPDNKGISGMFWRFESMDDSAFEYCLVRDADSRLNYRERMAVNQWIESGKHFHIMRDHPFHTRKIIGGAFGCMPYRHNLGIKKLLEEWPARGSYGNDETFLQNMVYPKVISHAMIHDSFPKYKEEHALPFPTPREGHRFVCERCHEDEHWSNEEKERLY